jgi:hypothetical protein
VGTLDNVSKQVRVMWKCIRAIIIRCIHGVCGLVLCDVFEQFVIS